MIFSTTYHPKKILIIKLKKLGDVLGTTPCVRQIKQLYPNADITFLSEGLGAQVYEFSNHINDVWVLSRKPTVVEYVKLIAKVNRAKFDVIIDLYHHNKTALMAMFSGAKYRLGFIHDSENVWSYNHTVSLTQHEKTSVSRTLHQLKLTNLIGTNFEDNWLEFQLDTKTEDFGKEFALNHDFGENTIAFCVQSERQDAQVPSELWVEIGNFLIETGSKLLFIYGPGEKEKAEIIYHQLLTNKDACVIDYPIPRIAETRAILSHCNMFVGNDGGNKHLAVAAGIPTIGLFYGDSPKVWTPNKPQHRFLQTKNNQNPFEQFLKIYKSWNLSKNEFVDK